MVMSEKPRKTHTPPYVPACAYQTVSFMALASVAELVYKYDNIYRLDQ